MEKNFTRTTVRNYINRVWQILSNQRFRDNDWSGFRNTIQYLQNQLNDRYGDNVIKINYYCEDGGYHQSSDGLSLWKEYIINVDNNEETIIKGYVNCCACGTISDPFSTYDMVFINWLNNDKE